MPSNVVDLLCQMDTPKLLLCKPAQGLGQLPVYYCPTCRALVAQPPVYPQNRYFIQRYCSHCGQALEAGVVMDGMAFPRNATGLDKTIVPIQEGASLTMNHKTGEPNLGRASVDAIDEGIVRIIFEETGEPVAFPLAALPQDIHEGAIIYQVDGVWLIDASAGNGKKEELRRRLDGLTGRHRNE